MKPHRKNSGFTLVELIVVLVVLAILAALLVPTLTGYIDKAREASIIAEARAVLVAAQATVTEAYGAGELKPDRTGTKFSPPSNSPLNNTARIMAKQIFALSEADIDHCEWQFYLADLDNSELATAKISLFTYRNKDSHYCVTYRAIATEDEPTGWSAVTRCDSLSHTDADGTVFLSSSAYNPELPD